jgi:hypothetical protein
MAKARFDAIARDVPHNSVPLVPLKPGIKRGELLLDWRKRISDHIAYALLVYTGLQIFVTIAALHGTGGSMLPSLALVLLVGGIIPACRQMERRWTRLSDLEAGDPALAGAFSRDRAIVWGGAIGLPFIVTGGFRLMSVLLG